jgi:mRNA interferase RelE/StbE
VSQYTIVWQPAAVAGLIRIRADDRQAAKVVRVAVGALAAGPRPPGSVALGGEGLHRLRLGAVRVLYDVDDERHAVHLLTVGRVNSGRG